MWAVLLTGNCLARALARWQSEKNRNVAAFDSNFYSTSFQNRHCRDILIDAKRLRQEHVARLRAFTPDTVNGTSTQNMFNVLTGQSSFGREPDQCFYDLCCVASDGQNEKIWIELKKQGAKRKRG
jgi:hypothetical protein